MTEMLRSNDRESLFRLEIQYYRGNLGEMMSWEAKTTTVRKFTYLMLFSMASENNEINQAIERSMHVILLTFSEKYYWE